MRPMTLFEKLSSQLVEDALKRAPLFSHTEK